MSKSKKFAPNSAELAQMVVALGELALQFGQTNRATYYPDGTTPESDTDHTIMLSLIACAFAKEYLPTLDIGMVAQYAIVHDLVEVYAGDTATLNLTPQIQADKDAREHKAYERIKSQFGAGLPWVPETIASYESLGSAEARYVKTFDKLMPTITHMLNGGQLLKEKGINPSQSKAMGKVNKERIYSTYGKGFEQVAELKDALSELLYTVYK